MDIFPQDILKIICQYELSVTIEKYYIADIHEEYAKEVAEILAQFERNRQMHYELMDYRPIRIKRRQI